jgi:tRNA threonylcarbamoyladenosine biosynthesis protein TsaE
MKRTVDEHEWEGIADELLDFAVEKKSKTCATIITLSGTLGAGKTTFTKALAKVLGVKSRVSSPTFILMKFFALPKHAPWKQLTHIDAYRLEKPEELVTIGWKEYAKNPDNLIVVEWPEKIQKLIPKGSIKVKLAYVGNRRSISF